MQSPTGLNTKQIKVIENFLPYESWKFIHDTMLGDQFPWYLNNAKVFEYQVDGVHNYQFTHAFYANHVPQGTAWSELFTPLLEAIKPFSIHRVKANLNPVTDTPIQSEWHVDLSHPDVLTAVYYVNSNNGHTIFRDGTKVESVANRFVSFPSHLEHSGTTCTDQKMRCLININYTP